MFDKQPIPNMEIGLWSIWALQSGTILISLYSLDEYSSFTLIKQYRDILISEYDDRKYGAETWSSLS